MEDRKLTLFKIISAGQCGVPDLEGKKNSDYFIIVGQNRKTCRYTVWAFPDRTGAFAQIIRLQRVISPEQFSDTYQAIVHSQIPDIDPSGKVLKIKGLAAQFYAKLVDECAALNEQLVRETRPSEYFNSTDLPS